MSRPTPRLGYVALVLAITGALFVSACGDNIVDADKDLTAFSFTSADNPALTADAVATVTGGSVAIDVPYGTVVTGLVATFSATGRDVTVKNVVQTSGVTANDFTAPVVYEIVAGDNSTQDYTVTVNVAPASAKALTAFAFLATNNAVLSADVTATINGATINATVPFGTNVSALVASYTTTGTSVTVGGAVQASGTTPNDFTSPLTYHVTADDGTAADYLVTVTIAPSNAKAITGLSFLAANNSTLAADITATISGNAISAIVPFGTNVSALVATFTTTGASVEVGTTVQNSGTTANNFASPVTYVVTAADGTTHSYTVTVTVASNTAAELTSFGFGVIPGTITGTSINVTVPAGTNVASLVATFTTSLGATVKVGITTQMSGVTNNTYATPLAYVVTAADGTTTKTFTVTVAVASVSAKTLTSFAFTAAGNDLPADAVGTITANAIAVTVPFGTNVAALVATFATSGTSVKVGTTVQVSGTTANSFVAPVTYIVTASDGSTTSYIVTVTSATNSAKALTSFAFGTAGNSLSSVVTATITGTTITATVPAGTSLHALIATFTTTGESVTVGATPQVSGVTANNFTATVTYTVTAADASTQTYTVTVAVAATTADDLIAFSFQSADNGGNLQTNVVGAIAGTAVSVVVPFGTDVTALVPRFTIDGTGVKAGGVAQISGITANNFTSAVTYQVTAANGSSQPYVVTVTIAPNPVTAFGFLHADNGTNVPTDVAGTVDTTTITVVLPFGTTLTSLIAAFTTTATSVDIGTTAQTTDVTTNDFSLGPVTYTFTSADGSKQTYQVSVTDEPTFCTGKSSGTTCGAPTCTGGLLTAAGTCDDSGDCLPGSTSACADDLGCTGTGDACRTACTRGTSSSCASPSTEVCNGLGTGCVLDAGETCSADIECDSDVCAGNCCTTACITTGTCGATSCSATGACVGPGGSTSCSSPVCVGSTLTVGACNGTGSCTETPGPCADNLACETGTACYATCTVTGVPPFGTSVGCAIGFFCSTSGAPTCVDTPAVVGGTCNNSFECVGDGGVQLCDVHECV